MQAGPSGSALPQRAAPRSPPPTTGPSRTVKNGPGLVLGTDSAGPSARCGVSGGPLPRWTPKTAQGEKPSGTADSGRRGLARERVPLIDGHSHGGAIG